MTSNRKKYILALDSGTTSNRALLIRRDGSIAGTVQKEFNQIFPSPGWVEHDPREIWKVQLSVMQEILEKNNGVDIEAIGITNQRETTIVWERETGDPVCNAIVWQDRRTAAFCEQLIREGRSDFIRDRTGLVIDAYFSASKIRWILENVKGARKKADAGRLAFGTVDSWLAWNLTGRHVTDPGNASRTMLYNIHKLEWDEELLGLFKIPRNMLPEVCPSSGIMGYTHPGPLGTRVPLAGMAGDQQAALFGQMCTSTGMVKNTYGTGCFVVMNTGEKPVQSGNRLLTTIAWEAGGKLSYALEGSIFIAGALVQWLRDKLGIIRTSAEIGELAAQVEDNGGVYFVPALTGLGAPHWDPYASGTLIGLSRDTSAAHIARAALEAIALQSTDVIRAMEQDSGIPMKELRVDGGASVNNLLMQIQADLLGKDVIRPEITETTAMGAGYLAGLATGFWGSEDELRNLWREEKRFSPGPGSVENKIMIENWSRAVERSRNWYRE